MFFFPDYTGKGHTLVLKGNVFSFFLKENYCEYNTSTVTSIIKKMFFFFFLISSVGMFDIERSGCE